MSTYGEATYGDARYGSTTTNTHLPDHFIPRLVNLMEFSTNHQVNRFIQAWIKAEGGNAKWNPLNTTLKLDGTVNWTEDADYNSTGVRNYKYAMVGVVASALTLRQLAPNGNLVYGGIVNDLKAGTKTAEQIVHDQTSEISHWGTDPVLMLAVLKTIT